MSDQAARILYLGARLPARSETFVYREVFALRHRDYTVHVASVHAPERGLGSDELDQLAEEAIPIYAAGAIRFCVDALGGILRRPVSTCRVLGLALKDALFGRGVPLKRRPKLLVQCLAAIALDRRMAHLVVDHIHAHMAHVPTTIAMYLAQLRGVPFSFTGHAADLFRDYALLPDKIRRARFIACISHWHQTYYQQMVPGISAAKLPVIRCGVGMPDELPVKSAGRSPLRILSVGRLVEKKGFDVLIQALARVRRLSPEFICQLVGDGPESDRLQALIREADLGDVLQLEGAADNDVVQRLMRKADLFVLPCRPTRSGDQDGIPVVLMEAMAAGVPVVSGDLPTIRELVQHQNNGWLVPPGRVEALEQAILELMNDAELRLRLGCRGREWVAKEFSLDTNIDRLSRALALDSPRGEAECREPQLC